MVFYKKPNAPEPRLHWITEGTTVGIYDAGDLITAVPVCFDYASDPNTNGFLISDVRYGSVDGVLMATIEDITEEIRNMFPSGTILTFEDEFHHEPRL